MSFVTTKYFVGEGSIGELKNWSGHRYGLILDSNVVKGELRKYLLDEVLKNEDYEILGEIAQEPTTELLEGPIQAVKTYEPSVLVGIGGGSTMDAGKVLWYFLQNPDATWEQAFCPYSAKPFTNNITYIAIPTTSGTGSEATGCAVVKDKNLSKRMILTNEIIPSYAIMDFNLLKTLPRSVVIFSGLDALAHALEAGVSTLANEWVQFHALNAATLILKNLQKSVEGDIQARKVMHFASSLAGSCIANSITGLAHGMDQAGGQFHKPHGLMTGLLLPYTMRKLIPQPLYSAVAENIGIKDQDVIVQQNKLVDWIFDLYQKIGMPIKLADTGIDEIEYMDSIKGYLEKARNDPNITSCPVELTENELTNLYINFYKGE